VLLNLLFRHGVPVAKEVETLICPLRVAVEAVELMSAAHLQLLPEPLILFRWGEAMNI